MTNNDSELSDSELIDEFRNDLLAHADKHGMKLTKIGGWTEPKIESMALNNRICCCDPSRTCPCDIGVEETMTEADHMCKCSVFVR